MIVMYTAQSGNYNIKRTDKINIHKGLNIFTNPTLEAKIFKVLGHLFYPQAEILIWIDGNITSNLSPEKLVEKYLKSNDFVISKHPYRDNIYEEFDELLKTKRLESIKHKIKEQKEFYLQNYRKINGLYECNFFIRRNTAAVNQMMCAWWSEICRFSQRDQVSFPIVLEKYRKHFKFEMIDLNDIRKNSDFNYINHY